MKHKSHRKGKKNKYDHHHIYPSSRVEKGDLGKFHSLLSSLNIRTLKGKHNAWHQLFLNHFSEEVISAIKKSFKSGVKTIPEIISSVKSILYHQPLTKATQNDIIAWRKVFGDHCYLRKIKKIIFENWTYPDIKTIINNGKITNVLIFLPHIPKELDIQVVTTKGTTHLKISEKNQAQIQ